MSSSHRSLAELRDAVVAQLSTSPVVLSAPTGTGKSTLVPCWFAGKVLVIEPRRLACQALAKRVASLHGWELGVEVGYRVRDDERVSPDTRIVFVTPGIVLQAPQQCAAFDVVILDEFHERRIDIDWLCAWLLRRKKNLLVMSATVDGDRVAEYLGGVHFEATARAFSVELEYLAPAVQLPDPTGLDTRVLKAIARAGTGDGDVLCFLPGKAEIRRIAEQVGHGPFDVYQLHGSMAIREQELVFRSGKARKLILSTNVAETSITLPGVRWVIDSGLVRRTLYHGGRGYLALTAIAQDSAEQRRGRAGRTAPGRCLRLWGASANLEASTPPEIFRESLTQMLLWSGASQVRLSELRFFDAPRPYALTDARAELRALGALSEDGELTARGRELHRIPLDPWYGRILVEAKNGGVLPLMIELVALLSQTPPVDLGRVDVFDDVQPCDACELLYWFHTSNEGGRARAEVRRTIARLRRIFGAQAAVLPKKLNHDVLRALVAPLLRAVLVADPGAAHVPRVRKRATAWAAGGTELALGRESSVSGAPAPPAIVVLGSRAMGLGRERRLLITRASAVPLKWLAEAGLGQERVSRPKLKGGTLTAQVERVYAGKVLGAEERRVTGPAARAAAVQLFVEGRLFRSALEGTKARLARRKLAAMLSRSTAHRHLGLASQSEPPDLTTFVAQRFLDLGLSSGDDLQLLAPDDLLPDDVPYELQGLLESEFPLRVDAGGCTYSVEYDIERRQVLLQIIRGSRKTPPPLAFLPRFRGFRICAEAGGGIAVLRERG